MTMKLDILSLSKIYEHGNGLKPTSFSVQKNELVAIVGHNGAGKSTLLKIIGQWIVPDDGRILLDGSDLKMHKKLCHRVSFVPEVPNLYDFFTVEYNLILFSLLFSQPLSQVEVVLRQLQLVQFKKQKVRSLSKGLKQRVSIARALISNPSILLLDEPTSGLDFEMTCGVYKLIRKMHSDNKTIIFSTHQPEEIKDLATRIIAIHKGEIIFDGPPQDYLSSSVHKLIQNDLQVQYQ